MRISILTIEPALFDSFLASHVVRRATGLGLLNIEIVDIREFAGGSFRHIDDSPIGGGNGMILRCGPILKALEHVKSSHSLTAALTPRGRCWDQSLAHAYVNQEHIILICGHYEGIDERVFAHADQELSIGDFVLTGGELAAQVIADSVIRLLPGVLRKGSSQEESFEQGLLEYPQYTQPADYEGERVPKVLLSGNHKAIREWRQEQALHITKERRPDLYREYLRR